MQLDLLSCFCEPDLALNLNLPLIQFGPSRSSGSPFHSSAGALTSGPRLQSEFPAFPAALKVRSDLRPVVFFPAEATEEAAL